MTYFKTCSMLLVSVLACASPVTSADQADLAVSLTPQERAWLATLPVMRVGVDPTAEPLSMIDREGRAQGLAMDYLGDAFQALGVRYTIVHDDDWAATVRRASAGEVDVLAAASPNNPQLMQQQFDFTAPYTEFPVMIVTRDDFVTISGPHDLGGRRIAANMAQGSVASAVAALSQVSVMDVRTAAAGLADVAEGRADAYVGDIATAELVIRRDFPARLRLAAPTGQRALLAMAVSQRYAPLRPLLDRALAAMPERRAQAIRNTWLRSHYTWGGSWQEIGRKVGPAGMPVLALLIGLAFAYVRLRRETARRERSERQLADVTRNIPAVVYRFLYHDDGRIDFTYVGGNPEPIFEIPAVTFLRDERHAFATIDPRDQTPLLEKVAHAAATLTHMHAEMRIRNAMPERWVASHAVPRRVGRSVEFTGYWIDVSLQHKQSAQLAEAKQAAEAATLAKNQFVATMSHEIRTPMHGVLGMLEMLRHSPLDTSQQRLLATAETSADALMQILDDVLDFSRIEAGQMVVEAAPLDCRRLVDDVVQLYAWQIAQKGLDVTVHVAADVATRIVTDGGRMRQILLNIVSNAVKFTDRGGIDLNVEVIAATPSSQRLRFIIDDTGIGIANADIEALFAPFTQAEASTTRRFGGSGLGLAISRRLVELLGGTLTLSGRAVGGTRAIFEIEATVAEPMAGVAGDGLERKDVAVPATASLDVVVAEDHAINRELVAAQLEKLGHRYRVAHDGREALDMVLSGPADVLLTDLHMPVMDGVSLTCELRRQGNAIRVVAMTANALQGEQERCAAAGMTGFVTKPVRLETLAAALAEQPMKTIVFGAGDLDELRNTFGTLSVLPALVSRFETATRADLAKRPSMRTPAEAADWIHRIVGGMRIFGPSPEAGCAEALEHDLRGEHGELAMPRLTLFVAAAERYLASLRDAVDSLPPE